MGSVPETGPERLTPRPGPSPWLFLVGGIFALACMAGAIIMPILASNNRNVNDTNCQANLKSLAAAALMYASENDGRLPAKGWDKALKKIQPDDMIYACPVQARIDPRSSGYAISDKVAGKEINSFQDQDQEILFFDSVVTQPGLTDKPTSTPRPGRHSNGRSNNVVYLDGQVRSIPTN